MSTPPWLDDLFAAIDARDTERFLGFLTEDVSLRFGNAPALKGAPSVREAMLGFFHSIAGLSHELEEAWDLGETVICRGLVTYTRRDGSHLAVPFANVFKLRGDRIGEYLVYVDNSALFAPA